MGVFVPYSAFMSMCCNFHPLTPLPGLCCIVDAASRAACCIFCVPDPASRAAYRIVLVPDPTFRAACHLVCFPDIMSKGMCPGVHVLDAASRLL